MSQLVVFKQTGHAPQIPCAPIYLLARLGRHITGDVHLATGASQEAKAKCLVPTVLEVYFDLLSDPFSIVFLQLLAVSVPAWWE